MARENRSSNIYSKIDFKLKLVKEDKEGNFILTKGASKGKKNNYQPLCTQCQCIQLLQTYIEGLKSTNTPQHNGSGIL
jgi:hypothetical protein